MRVARAAGGRPVGGADEGVSWHTGAAQTTDQLAQAVGLQAEEQADAQFDQRDQLLDDVGRQVLLVGRRAAQHVDDPGGVEQQVRQAARQQVDPEHAEGHRLQFRRADAAARFGGRCRGQAAGKGQGELQQEGGSQQQAADLDDAQHQQRADAVAGTGVGGLVDVLVVLDAHDEGAVQQKQGKQAQGDGKQVRGVHVLP